jgi:RNA polymerase sigma-70 factor (ECF subfamily)
MDPIAPSGLIVSSAEPDSDAPRKRDSPQLQETSSTVAEIEDFDRVVQTYWPRVFRFILASVRESDAAETLTQDCFWRAYRHRKGFRGDCSVNTWLLQIAVNLVRDFGRNRRLQFWKRARSASLDVRAIGDWLPDRRISPEEKTVVMEQVQAVWRATSTLSPKQRTVFLLRFVEDMDLLEIAAAAGLSEGAVKVHLFRAVHSIRKQIGSLK